MARCRLSAVPRGPAPVVSGDCKGCAGYCIPGGFTDQEDTDAPNTQTGTSLTLSTSGGGQYSMTLAGDLLSQTFGLFTFCIPQV